MPSPRRESIHNSNCGFRHHKRDKKMFSKNEDRNRNNNRGRRGDNNRPHPNAFQGAGQEVGGD